MSSGDIFGFRTRTLDLGGRETVLVYPKIVPVEGGPFRLPPAWPLADERAARRLIDDPLSA